MPRRTNKTLIGLAVTLLLLAIAAPAQAASTTWDRAWGKGVNGGSVFAVCTVVASCLTGSSGDLGGEMGFVWGIATDSSDNVYVTDITHNRIQKFDSSGTWERAWGKGVNGGTAFGVCTVAASCQAGQIGTLGGEIIPDGVATDSSGNVYVTDVNNQRIQKFDSSGNWERAWGRGVNGGGAFGVCTVAASCRAGTVGGLGGELRDPYGVTVDSVGTVLVGDTVNARIQEFDSSGAWQRAWGREVDAGGGTGFEVCTVAASCQTGLGFGFGWGCEIGPRDVATDSGGNVYLVHSGVNRIEKFVQDPVVPPAQSDCTASSVPPVVPPPIVPPTQPPTPTPSPQQGALPVQQAAPQGKCRGAEATILGTKGDDVLIGTPGRDVIQGLRGKDIIKGKGGNDRLCGARGIDRIFGGKGNDVLIGGDQSDLVNGGPGHDRLFGGTPKAPPRRERNVCVVQAGDRESNCQVLR